MLKNRKSPRAQRYDYSSSWAYFITICTKNREHYFGNVKNNIIHLNELGQFCTKHRKKIPDHYANIICDEFICMPNHIHGIIIITDPVGTQFLASRNNYQSRTDKNPSLHDSCASWSLGAIIRWFKIGITKYAKQNTIPFLRQWRYHDHIIRNHDEYERIKHYIQQNPANRTHDKLHNESTYIYWP